MVIEEEKARMNIPSWLCGYSDMLERRCGVSGVEAAIARRRGYQDALLCRECQTISVMLGMRPSSCLLELLNHQYCLFGCTGRSSCRWLVRMS